MLFLPVTPCFFYKRTRTEKSSKCIAYKLLITGFARVDKTLPRRVNITLKPPRFVFFFSSRRESGYVRPADLRHPPASSRRASFILVSRFSAGWKRRSWSLQTLPFPVFCERDVDVVVRVIIHFYPTDRPPRLGTSTRDRRLSR